MHGDFAGLTARQFLQIVEAQWRAVMHGDVLQRRARDEAAIRNDCFGRETVTWIRQFQTRRPRRFDAYMIWSQQRSRIVDYLGTHQHLAVDLDLRVDKDGGLRVRSGEQRFYEGPLAFRFPMLFSGIAEVREWFDEKSGKFRISVNVRNKWWGPLFGYSGWFDAEWIPLNSGHVPPAIRPRREEPRE